MKVTLLINPGRLYSLAYDKGEVVDIDDALAQVMVDDGHAKIFDENAAPLVEGEVVDTIETGTDDLNQYTVAQLKSMLDEKEIAYDSSAKKADLIELLIPTSETVKP